MATAEITVLPIGREGAGVGDVLAEVQRRLMAQDKVRYEMHAMGTALEGDIADIFETAAALHAVPFEHGIPRVYTLLKVDQRSDRDQSLADKLRSVEDRLS
jgi:uncharacterized protein (TIGR00106 family)